jgi:hypothetical protein
MFVDIFFQFFLAEDDLAMCQASTQSQPLSKSA